MRAHYFQHVPFEGLGSIAAWLDGSGFKTTGTKFFESPLFPEVGEIDLLIIMGGPMSVNEEEKFSWLAAEKEFIRKAFQSGVPVLGVCLGAQLIASALGAPVYQNAEKEIGWFPIQGTTNDDPAVFRFPPELTVFHWHGETFDLPEAAVHLAQSAACRNQAFQLGRSTIGLQFHLETTPESARTIVSHCREELVPAEYIQSETEILTAPVQTYQQINRLMDRLLTFLTGK